ncbi:MAG: hypothetical protein EZS28_017572 [Streblomastix strix]|uniref:Uncharacterized protein n=1 Tax=Streblomastix strix TaxID=222440 RepID=A0A5J4VWP8_9EUKA|nr:MAG: hypothetical protein EZS28_017572 [Streblomastix strix]
MTQAKKDIKRASRSKVDDIIIDHIKQFKDVWRTLNGQRKTFYKMKEEIVKIYENMLDDDADEKEAEAQTG